MSKKLSFGERTIFAEGYGFSPKKVMRDPSISIELKGFYAYISSYTGGGVTAWPGTKRIMQELGIGKQRLFKLIKEAQEKGLIKVEKVRNEKGQFMNNTYHIVVELTKAQHNPCPTCPDTANPDTAHPYPARPDTNSNIDLKVTDTNSNSKYKYSPDHLVVAEHLLARIRENKPDYKEPNLKKWADDIRKMEQYDNRSLERIKEVIDWCQKDNFWCSNILSADKLRKQFDRLEMEMARKQRRQKDVPRAFRLLQEWVDEG